MFLRLVLSIRDIIDIHLDSCPLSDTWYGVILWVFEFGVRAPKQSVRESNFRAERLCSLRRNEEQKNGETAVYCYDPALFLLIQSRVDVLRS